MTDAPSKERSVILTFDDGPEPVEATDAILNALDAEGVKGCFFLLGEGVQRHPDIVRRLVEGGHEAGNHNFHHVQIPTLPEEEILDQLRRTQEAIQAAAGVTPRRLRPPFGAGWYHEKHPPLARSAAALGLEVVVWSLDTHDWKKPFGIRFDRVRTRFEEFVATGNTSRIDILMHVHTETARDLPELIAFLRGLGFGFTSY
jgi:peptidoglycan-N-acetylglucosamine deacetylase